VAPRFQTILNDIIVCLWILAGFLMYHKKYKHVISVLFYFSGATENLMAKDSRKFQFFRSFLDVLQSNLAIGIVIQKL
jgi:hypothetical protein